MKPILLLALLVFLSAPCFSQEQDQFQKLKLLEGTWQIDLDAFASQGDYPAPPNMQVNCQTVTEGNGMYCKVSVINDNGEGQVISSELLAYNQSTGKIHLMLFDGQNVTYGTGMFTDNVFSYTDTDATGKPLYDGELIFEDNRLRQEISVPGETETMMTMIFNKVD